MMLQHIFLSQDIPKNLGVLLNDGGIGNHINQPAQSMRAGVTQGKGQRGRCLAAPGGNSEGIQPWGLSLSLFHTALQHCAPLPVQLRFGREPAGDMGLELVPQYFYRVPAAPFLYFSRHKCLGVQKIRVYQTGVEHPGEEYLLQKIGELFPVDHRQLNFLPPSLIGFKLSQGSLLHAAAKGIVLIVVALPPAVGQTSVVPRDSKGGTELIQLTTLRRAGGGVVNLCPSVQPALESR